MIDSLISTLSPLLAALSIALIISGWAISIRSLKTFFNDEKTEDEEKQSFTPELKLGCIMVTSGIASSLICIFIL